MQSQSKVSFKGIVLTRANLAPGPVAFYRLRNLHNVWPGLWRHKLARLLKMNHMIGELRAVLFHKDGSRVNYGLISTRLVTTVFVNDMVDELIAESSAWGDYKFHDSGVGVTGAAVGDTDIETTDGESRATGNQVENAANIYESVGTIAYTTTKAITEHGLFNVVTGGIMMDHHVFSAINVVNGDSIEFTYRLTCTAGG